MTRACSSLQFAEICAATYNFAIDQELECLDWVLSGSSGIAYYLPTYRGANFSSVLAYGSTWLISSFGWQLCFCQSAVDSSLHGDFARDRWV